ncbi:hypothetical protein [Cupriavidus sp. UYPR2.512]|uniref:hypothetical protein n=1 Tax=Cupriavidus sp. UYPR2.512 TaxID=1080187 RepID=UPI0012FCBC34|nr:hypothetical protein [Cupriavidus sp. UYPR2.512]UIF89263.1 hypothetical protein KAF44_30255 [Cupriavidus necator]
MNSPSVSTETVLLLDRNAIAIIKDAVAGKPQPDEKKQKALDALRALDVPENSISPLFSIIEGEKGREDGAAEKAVCLEKETDVVAQFFRHANTDAAHLRGLQKLVTDLFTGMKESLWDQRAEYLTRAAPLVLQKVAEKKRLHVEGQLIQLARSCGVAPNDGIVMLFLACLYGSDAARGVIKPKAPDPYNVLTDLHVIPRIGMVRAVVRMLPRPVRVRFWTLDEGLFAFLSNVDIVDPHFTADGDLQMQVRYKPALFPDLIKGGDTAAADSMLHRIAAASDADAEANAWSQT